MQVGTPGRCTQWITCTAGQVCSLTEENLVFSTSYDTDFGAGIYTASLKPNLAADDSGRLLVVEQGGWNASVELAHAAIVMPIRHGANNKDRPRNGLGKSGLARASVRLEHAARTLHVRHWNGKPKIVQPIEHVDSMFLDHPRTCRPPCRSSST